MAARNVTLSIDEALLQRARVVAARRRSTVSQMVRDYLDAVVKEDHLAEEARKRLRVRLQSPAMAVGDARWDRDSLHDR